MSRRNDRVPLHKQPPYVWPHPDNFPNVVYRYEENGKWLNRIYNELWPLFGIIPWRNGNEYETFRCKDLYPLCFGMEYLDLRGCSFQQFKDEADLIRCKNCYQAFDKKQLVQIFGGEIKDMQQWERAEQY